MTVVLWVVLGVGPTAASASDVCFRENFEQQTIGQPPKGWSPFWPKAKPSVAVVSPGAFGSTRCLIVRHTVESGFVAISRPFVRPRDRVRIELSFAFSAGPGRQLNISTRDRQNTGPGPIRMPSNTRVS